MTNLVDLNLLLKSLLFACLFFILSDKEVVKALVGGLSKVAGKLSQQTQQVLMMVVFIICYYVISLFI